MLAMWQHLQNLKKTKVTFDTKGAMHKVTIENNQQNLHSNLIKNSLNYNFIKRNIIK